MKWRADVCVDLTTKEITEINHENDHTDNVWEHWLKTLDLDFDEETGRMWVLVEYDDEEEV